MKSVIKDNIYVEMSGGDTRQGGGEMKIYFENGCDIITPVPHQPASV